MRGLCKGIFTVEANSIGINQPFEGSSNLLYAGGCVRESLLLRHNSIELNQVRGRKRNLLYAGDCVRESLLLRKVAEESS